MMTHGMICARIRFIIGHNPMTRTKIASKRRQRQTALVSKKQTSRLADFLNRPRFDLGKADIALLNLLCAVGLPGTEKLDIPRLLGILDDWACLVRLATERNYYKFLDSPGAFNNSSAYFCVLYMITVLQRGCGVCYNPKWTDITPDKPIPSEFGRDAEDQFIHAIIDGPGGTCGSLPVLYAAVGRRLGYPLRIVKAFRHIFLRWDDPGGKHWFHPDRFNIEATGPGIHCLPDEHYKTWPHKIPREYLEAGIYLKSLTPQEERAEFINARANCIMKHGKLGDAVKAMRKAVELAPHNRRFRELCDNWESRRWLLARKHFFLSEASVTPPDNGPKPPHWVKLRNGQEILVQVPRSGGYLPPIGPFNLGRPLTREQVWTPNGQYVAVDVPLRGSGGPMEAFWVQLPGGMDYALVHRPLDSMERLQQQTNADQQPNGQPIVPKGSLSPTAIHFGQVVGSPGLVPWIEQEMVDAIRQENRQGQLPHEQLPFHPPTAAVALPQGPIPPRLRIGEL